MNTKHTPGPWKLIDEARNANYLKGFDYEGTVQHCWYIAGPAHDSDFVADIITDSRNVGHANARLIAASPVLLEALKGIVEPFKLACEIGAPSCDPERHVCIVAARAAIAQATGEEP